MYDFSLSYRSVGVKKIYKSYIHQQNMTIFAPPQMKSPTLGDMKFTILVEGFLVYIIMNLVYLINMQEERRKFLNNICNNNIRLIWLRPRVITPTLGNMKFTMLLEGFLIYTIMIICMIIFDNKFFSYRCEGVKKKKSNFDHLSHASMAPIGQES